MSQKEPKRFSLKDKNGKEYEFEFYMLDPDTAWDYSTKLMKLIAPGAATVAIATQTGTGGDQDVSSMISTLVDKLDESEVTKLMKLLMAKTHYNNLPLKGDTFTAFFTNRLSMQWILFLTALEVQFGDFLPDIFDWLKQKIESTKGEALAA